MSASLSYLVLELESGSFLPVVLPPIVCAALDEDDPSLVSEGIAGDDDIVCIRPSTMCYAKNGAISNV